MYVCMYVSIVSTLCWSFIDHHLLGGAPVFWSRTQAPASSLRAAALPGTRGRWPPTGRDCPEPHRGGTEEEVLLMMEILHISHTHMISIIMCV